MYLLGVELKKPDAKEAKLTILLSLLYLVIWAIIFYFNIIPKYLVLVFLSGMIVGFLSGMIGGAFASSFGVRISRDGWQGHTVLMIFSLITFIIFAILIFVFDLQSYFVLPAS